MKKAVAVFGILVTVFIILLSHNLGHFRAGADEVYDTEDSNYEYCINEENQETQENVSSKTQGTSSGKETMIHVETDPDNIAVLVNRQYPMSSDYVPADLVVPDIRFSFYGTYEKSYVRQVTADALEKLFAEAENQGLILKGVSGYRSYERQKQIYDKNVLTRGESTTDLVSAKPGTSEHQTGLTIDVSSDSVDCELEESFGETAEGKWLAKNCHKFGFIIRYPKDKTRITGYSYEPWHIRYVGVKLATYLYKKDWTLEEYYQYTTKDDKIIEQDTQINDTEGIDDVDEPEMTSPPTPKPTDSSALQTPTVKPSDTPKPSKKPAATRKPKATKTPKPTKKPTPKPTQMPEEESSEVPDPTEAPVTTQEPEVTEGTAPAEGNTEDGNSVTVETVQ